MLGNREARVVRPKRDPGHSQDHPPRLSLRHLLLIVAVLTLANSPSPLFCSPAPRRSTSVGPAPRALPSCYRPKKALKPHSGSSSGAVARLRRGVHKRGRLGSHGISVSLSDAQAKGCRGHAKARV